MPELHLYVRVLDYEGGAHVFADGSDVRGKLKLNADAEELPPGIPQ